MLRGAELFQGWPDSFPARCFFDGRADKGDHTDPDESFGEKGALNILPICIGCGIVLNKNGKPVDKFWSEWYTTVR